MLMRTTLIGMYNYDNTIFDGLILPDGLNRENVINATLDKGEEFGLMIPDPDALKAYITQWSARKYRTFERWRDAIDVEYSPIRDYYLNETYEGREEESRNKEENEGVTTVTNEEGLEQGSVTSSSTGNETIDKDSTETVTEDNSSSGTKNGETATTGNVETEEKVSGFDSSDYVPKSLTNEDSSNTVTTEESDTSSEEKSKTSTLADDTGITRSSSETESNSKSNNVERSENRIGNASGSEERSGEDSHNRNVVGLTGRRSVQELIEQEMKIAKINVEELIADTLVADICIMVY